VAFSAPEKGGAMKQVHRYIIQTIIQANLATLLILVGIISFVELANELGVVGKGGYNFFTALQYVFLVIPRDIYLFFPMVGLIGAIVGLGMLASSSELLVMRATGLSVFELSKTVALGAFLLCILVGIIGEGFGPELYKKAEAIKEQAIYRNQALLTSEGLWLHAGNDFLHVGQAVSQFHLRNVTYYVFNANRQMTSIAHADQVNYIGNRWVAHELQRTQLMANKTTTTVEANVTLQMHVKPNVMAIARHDPMSMNLVALTQYISYLKTVGLSTDQYRLIFWQRVLQPLASIVMIVLAIPFVFGSQRSGTVGQRLLLGIVVGLIFYLLSQLAGQVSLVYHIPPFLSAIVPILLFLLLSMYLIFRVK